jgi:hypothetical protein
LNLELMLEQLFLETVQRFLLLRRQCFEWLVIGVQNEWAAAKQKVKLIDAVDCRS